MYTKVPQLEKGYADWKDALCDIWRSHSCFQSPLYVVSEGSMKRLKLGPFASENWIWVDSSERDMRKVSKFYLKRTLDLDFDTVIAIGGGFTLDVAKLILASKCFDTCSAEVIKDREDIIYRYCPSIFIPTTCGSGSEATPYATVWDLHNKRKFSIRSEDLVPNYAILDSHLLLSMPQQVAHSSMMDAIAHCIDSFLSVKRTEQSQLFAREALSAIVPKLNANDHTYRDVLDLMVGAYYAGRAIAISETSLCHALSYPLTLHYGIPHGIACGMMLATAIDCHAALDKYLERIVSRGELSSRILLHFEVMLKKWNAFLRDENPDINFLANCASNERMSNYSYIDPRNESEVFEAAKDFYKRVLR